MGQYWEFLNLSRREQGTRLGGAKFPEFFFMKQEYLMRSLTVPFESAKVKAWLEDDVGMAPSPGDVGLLRFPNELLMEILVLCPTLRTKVCFALTCKRLLSLSCDHIDKLKTRLAAPWAGDRIICLGDYAEYRDLPRGLLTEEEKHDINKMLKDHEFDGSSYGGLDFMMEETTQLFLGTMKMPGKLKQFLERFPRGDRERFNDLYGLHYPNRDDWVLCNLTTGEYVRAAALAARAKRPKDKQPFLPKCSPDLGHAVLYKICWSSDDMLGPDCDFYLYEGAVARGEWAGHKFCITTAERMPALPEDKEWVDISKEVVRDLTAIWESSSWGEE